MEKTSDCVTASRIPHPIGTYRIGYFTFEESDSPKLYAYFMASDYICRVGDRYEVIVDGTHKAVVLQRWLNTPTLQRIPNDHIPLKTVRRFLGSPASAPVTKPPIVEPFNIPQIKPKDKTMQSKGTIVKVENVTFITNDRGEKVRATEFSDDELIILIRDIEDTIKSLQAISTSSVKVSKRIADLTQSLSDIGTLLDNRP